VSGLVERVVGRRGEYHHPVTLMEASEAAPAVPGAVHVGMGMAEPLNMVILAQRHGYEVVGDRLGPNELVIAVRAEEAGADEALAVVERLWLERAGAREVLDVGAYVFVGDEGVERLQWRWPLRGATRRCPVGSVVGGDCAGE
jgi:hypothetical protein